MDASVDLPHNLRRCDRDAGGCGTPFSITLDQCPNCQRPADGDSVPGEQPPTVGDETSVFVGDAPPETTEQQPVETSTAPESGQQTKPRKR